MGNSNNCTLQGLPPRRIPHPRTASTHAQYTEILYDEEAAHQASTQVTHPRTSAVPSTTTQKKLDPEHTHQECIIDAKENIKHTTNDTPARKRALETTENQQGNAQKIEKHDPNT